MPPNRISRNLFMEWDPGAIKVERILGRLALEAVLGREELPLDEAAGCSTFKVLFSSSAKASRAHACLNTHAISAIATESLALLILKPAHVEGTYAFFKVGTGVRHFTMFPRSRNPSRIYDTLANFGSVSLLYPHQDLGWIVHFENEEGACEAESKMSEIYTVDSMKKIPIDPTLYPEFSLNVVSNPSQSSIGIAPILVLSFDCIDNVSDWVIEQSSSNIWDYCSLFPKLHLSVLVISIMFKLHKWWIHFSAAN